MKFEWALSELRCGRKVWRKSWYVPWSKLQNHLWVEKDILRGLFSDRVKWEDYDAEDWEEHTSKSVGEEVMGEPV